MIRPRQGTSCHSYARVGGVRTAHLSTKFCILRAQWPGRKRKDHSLLGSPPKPSEAGSVGGGGARERHDGCPCLGVRNKADFAATMPAGRKYLFSRRASPVDGGPGTIPPVRGRWPVGPEGVGNAAYERPLREGAHRRRPRRFFRPFLIVQKGTTPPCPAPQGGTPIQTQKTAPAGIILRGHLLYWKRI